MSFVTRFAPSPNGFLHLGHAYSALRAFDAAREAQGRFLLRIEDIDTGRARADFEAAVYRDLAWLGITWEQPVRRQSEHFAEYARVIDSLEARGLVYPCYCTRREIETSLSAPHGPQGYVYPGTCRGLTDAERARRTGSGEAFVRRLDLSLALKQPQVTAGAPPLDTDRLRAVIGDVVLARKDILVGYHIAAVHDDALQGVTDVIRGDDLAFAEPLHRVLQRLLGYPEPRYAHHRLIFGSDGRRLAKRDLASTLHALRKSGVTPEQIRERLAADEPS